MYLMTFDGFTFLAMGFTGSKAAQFKEQYIKAFNDIRQKLVALQATPSPVEFDANLHLLCTYRNSKISDKTRKT